MRRYSFYRPPAHVYKMPGPMDEVSCCAYLDRTQKHKSAIPPELSFEKVVSDMALSPCSLQDFLVSSETDA